jgi:hypothetical protein
VAVQAATLSVTSGSTTVSVNLPALAANEDVIVGRAVTVTVGDAVAVTGDIALSQDRTTGQVLVLGQNGTATLVTEAMKAFFIVPSRPACLSSRSCSLDLPPRTDWTTTSPWSSKRCVKVSRRP